MAPLQSPICILYFLIFFTLISVDWRLEGSGGQLALHIPHQYLSGHHISIFTVQARREY